MEEAIIKLQILALPLVQRTTETPPAIVENPVAQTVVGIGLTATVITLAMFALITMGVAYTISLWMRRNSTPNLDIG